MRRCERLKYSWVAGNARQQTTSYSVIQRHCSSVTGEDEGQQLPKSARVVICGGGISGCSVAYHLSKLGWTDVVLLEKGSLTCGTTWHAAGVLGKYRASTLETECAKISFDLYASLEEETGFATGFRECGNIMVAKTKDRMISYKKILANSRLAGIECELLTPEECEKYHPLLYTGDIEGGLYQPNDACVNPSDVCQALARAATKAGVKIFEKVEVQKILTGSGKIYGVQTNQGYIKCEYLVNCGGMWARDIGFLSRPTVNVPLQACEHYYLITKPLEDIDTASLPTFRDHDSHLYGREWSGGLLIGCFEPEAKPAFLKGIPDYFEFQMLPEDWDHFQPMLENMLARVPRLGQAEVRQLFVGPESFTPDTKLIFGEVPEIGNYFIAAGFNSSGIILGGGTGQILADWMVNGKPRLDTSVGDIKRFCDTHNNKAFLQDRVKEVVGLHYALRHPTAEFTTARNVLCSPLHPRLEAAGAVFGEKAGWERPLYVKEPESDDFLDDDKQGINGLFGKPCWFDILKREHKACREDVGLLDMTSFAKFELQSPGSEATNLLQYLCCGDINMPIGNIVHTAMLNSRGGFENDCSVFRMAHNHYFIISPSFKRTTCYSWLKKHMSNDSNIVLRDVTNIYTALNVMGPKSKELLQEFTSTPLDSSEFKPFTGKTIDIGYASGVRALAMTHCGEKGWMLYIPNEMALPVYDSIMQRQQSYGIQNVGYYVYQNLRIEKFLTFVHQDFNSMNTPYETGRTFQVRLDKDSDFMGRKALAAQKESGVKKRLAMFFLDDHDIENELWPWGKEPIYRNGQFTGMTTSVGYGFSLNKVICIGWITNVNPSTGQELVVTNDHIVSGHYEVEIFGKRYAATARFYPPTN
ncbi:pyruvate dehydrogenase phosphatase regulatory subunit, mitochondrial-like [Glandiceps talaboti]